MIKKILVLCLGNICRSPIAEVLLREQAKAKQLDLSVDSAGITAMEGWSANPTSQTLMEERQLSLKNHVAKQVTAALVKEADLILVMDEEQRRMLERKFHEACGKTFRIGHHGGFDVEDPYQKERAAFEDAMRKIEQGAIEWLEFIA